MLCHFLGDNQHFKYSRTWLAAKKTHWNLAKLRFSNSHTTLKDRHKALFGMGSRIEFRFQSETGAPKLKVSIPNPIFWMRLVLGIHTSVFDCTVACDPNIANIYAICIFPLCPSEVVVLLTSNNSLSQKKKLPKLHFHCLERPTRIAPFHEIPFLILSFFFVIHGIPFSVSQGVSLAPRMYLIAACF